MDPFEPRNGVVSTRIHPSCKSAVLSKESVSNLQGQKTTPYRVEAAPNKIEDLFKEFPITALKVNITFHRWQFVKFSF